MKHLILAGLLLWGAVSFARAEGNERQTSAGDGARIALDVPPFSRLLIESLELEINRLGAIWALDV